MTDDLSGSSDQHPSGQRSIGEVLSLLQPEFPDISISKIRFLESRGLVEPHRAPSGYRKFAAEDVDRLRWILTMQRDHFLPLRVIKDRLDSGLDSHGVSEGDDDGTVATTKGSSTALPSPEPAARPKTSRFQAGASAEDLSPADFARLAGLSAQQLDQLIKFGLLDPHETDDGARFAHDELRVGKAAASFLEHGIEARHLKAWRVAAEREAGMLEQIVTPLGRKGSAEASDRARDIAEDLIDMGNVIREAIIVKSMRNGLGLGSD